MCCLKKIENLKTKLKHLKLIFFNNYYNILRYIIFNKFALKVYLCILNV